MGERACPWTLRPLPLVPVLKGNRQFCCAPALSVDIETDMYWGQTTI
jgi:hypothetical protein